MTTRHYPFDARPLQEPVTGATARAFVQELRRTGRAPSTVNWGGLIVVAVAVPVFLMMGGVVLSTIITMASSGRGFAFGVLPVVFVAAVVVVVAVRVLRGSGRNERWYRLDRFARANGMTWHPQSQQPPLPGMIFGLGRDRHALDVVRGDRPRFVEFGNYRYTTGSGKNQTTHQWGYIAVKLSSPLPHIVLDAVGNNGLFGSNLPMAFDKSQRLGLEGDFDRYFALYCPRGYEADALYLFTPDIMARFIDNAAALDVEIVDDWMFLYAKRDFATLDPTVWAWLFSVVGALLDKFAQWERWRDDRLAHRTAVAGAAPQTAVGATDAAAHASVPFTAPVAALRPPPGVAAAGRRLKRGVAWPTVIIMAVVIIGFAAMQLWPMLLR